MEDRVKWPNWSPFAKIYDPLQSGSIDGTDTTPHDRALIRAMEAKYAPPNKKVVTPDAEKTIFVGRLDHKTTEENLRLEFSRYGTITNCRIVKDVVTGFSKGYAFVQFKHLEDAENARRDAHRAVLDGREILVEWENGRTMLGWIPRRLGGGFGGKKESGQLRFGGRDRPFRRPIVIKPLGSSNLEEEEDAHRSQERDRRPVEEEESEKGSTQTEYSKDGRFPRKNFNKSWDRSNPGSSRVGRSWRDRNEEDRRYSKSSNEWDSYRGEKSRMYSSKRDRNERDDYQERSSLDRKEWEKDDKRYSNKSSRDRGEDKRYSDKSSRDREEGRSSKMSSQDRNEWEDSNERERRKNCWKPYYDRENIEEQEENQERSRKMREEEERRGESRLYKKSSKSSKRSLDEDDVKVKEEVPSIDGEDVRVKEKELPPNYGYHMGDWEDTPERDEKSFIRSPKDREDEEDSAEESKHKKRSKRSRDRSETKDYGHDQKSKKRKKKRSKKSSRDDGDSDDSDERRKEKKKRKKKKSRD